MLVTADDQHQRHSLLSDKRWTDFTILMLMPASFVSLIPVSAHVPHVPTWSPYLCQRSVHCPVGDHEHNQKNVRSQQSWAYDADSPSLSAWFVSSNVAFLSGSLVPCYIYTFLLKLWLDSCRSLNKMIILRTLRISSFFLCISESSSEFDCSGCTVQL